MGNIIKRSLLPTLIRQIRNILHILRTIYINEEIKRRCLSGEKILCKEMPNNVFEPLTEGEKQEVVNLWGTRFTRKHPHFKEFEFQKHINGFDARFASNYFFFSGFKQVLNEKRLTWITEDKSLLGWVSKNSVTSKLRFPYCYVRKIKGRYYDNEMQELTRAQAIDALLGVKEFCIKPTVESTWGQMVKFFDHDDLVRDSQTGEILSVATKEGMFAVFKLFGDNFVAQEVVKQCDEMVRLNESSVNTLRIYTLAINGRTSILHSAIRVGQKGARVDNFMAHSCGVAITHGVVGKAVNGNREWIDNINGIPLSELGDFSFVKDIEDILVDEHTKLFPFSRFIGWDIAVEKGHQPVIIEANATGPGITFIQQLCGPIFGDRTQEVIDFCRKRSFVYHGERFKLD